MKQETKKAAWIWVSIIFFALAVMSSHFHAVSKRTTSAQPPPTQQQKKKSADQKADIDLSAGFVQEKPKLAQNVELVPTLFPGEQEKPAEWMHLSTKPIQFLSARGHWKSLDKNNPVAGFPVSEISCDKPGLYTPEWKGGCREQAATVLNVMDMGLQVVPDYNEYEIVSWRTDGLTARYSGGACQISHTLEIDFTTGSILITDAPTKIDPALNKLPECSTPPATYQLMEGETFSLVPKKQDSTGK